MGNRSQNPNRVYGVTEPISMAGPSESDMIRNRELEKVRLVYLFYLVSLIWSSTDKDVRS